MVTRGENLGRGGLGPSRSNPNPEARARREKGNCKQSKVLPALTPELSDSVITRTFKLLYLTPLKNAQCRISIQFEASSKILYFGRLYKVFIAGNVRSYKIFCPKCHRSNGGTKSLNKTWVNSFFFLSLSLCARAVGIL